MVACKGNTAQEKQYTDIQVTDFRGQKLQLEQPAQKVVCLIESALSGIYMLGQQESVVGVPGDVYRGENWDRYADLDIRIKNKSLPTPGNWDFVSLEQVVGLEPDLVIIWSSQIQAIENIERFDIPVYAVMLHDIDDVFKEISDLGKLFGREERASELIGFTKAELGKLKQIQITKNRKTAYFMWAQGINETSGSNSMVESLFQLAGVKNACELPDEHVTINIEKLYDWDPDMIVMWYNEKLNPADVISNPLLKGLKAVQNENVYELPSAFECDFWTLKFLYSSQLVHFWAYGNTDMSSEPAADAMLQFLYNNNKTDE
ncbi:MAG: ABC transporter substrate-binding protein [Bacteroidetes bacterium]|nr:ABC transporter substrate-binding protein [Bacteroidota bacterium]